MMAEQPSETMPGDVRQAFADAVRLFNRWRFDTPPPTIPFRAFAISLSGVCDLVLAYKSEPLPTDVHHELRDLMENPNIGLKAELAIDPSYVNGARCLDTLIQDRRSRIAEWRMG
jgi:hypothetical protein